MKGIGSSRKKARLGFSTALVHVIKACSKYISLKEVHQMIDEHQVLTGSATGNVRNGHGHFLLIDHLNNVPDCFSNDLQFFLSNYQLVGLLGKEHF